MLDARSTVADARLVVMVPEKLPALSRGPSVRAGWDQSHEGNEWMGEVMLLQGSSCGVGVAGAVHT